jgi:soluble cytochrome b562
MSKCLNLGDKNISKMVNDFGEVTVSKLLDTYFPNTMPTYQDFISNKNIKQELGLIPISKVKEEIGRSLPKQINGNQLISLKATVSAINNRNFKNNVPTVYSLYNIKQVGQSDLNTWGLKKLKGTLDIEAKLERAKNRIVDPGQSNISVSDLEAMIDNDEYFDYEEELTPQEQSYEEEARQIQREDAQRLGIAYDDSYLFQLTNDENDINFVNKAEVSQLELPFPIEVNPIITEEQLNLQFEEVRRLDELEVEEPEDTIEEPDTIKGKAIAIALAEKLKTAFGMEYEVITPEMAKLILERTPTPYGNQPAFFHANKIYIIEGNVTADNVLHEFAHPLIKGILKQNPELFKSLFSQLQSTIEGQDIIASIKAEYPDLEEGSDRFMEEAMVTSIERMASQKANNQTAFGKFIEKLMFAVKKVLRSLFTGKMATSVNLNKLNAKTTLGQLANMLANKEFVIEDLQIEPSEVAEFKSNEIAERIAELKAVPVVELQQQIDKIYNDVIRQLNALKQAPFKVKEELLKSKSTKILNYVKEELEKYQTINISAKDVNPDNIINAIADIEQETKLRSLALINSLNEIKIFTEGIDIILKDIKGSAKQTNENISKVVYYKGFLKTQQDLISNLKTIPGLSKDSLFYKTLNSIGDSIITANSKIKEIEFNFISEFFNNETELMGDAVETNFRDRVNLILKAEGVAEAEIETFINKILNNPDGKTLKVKDLGLNIDSRRAKRIVNAAQEYYHKRLGRDQIQEYLRGERGDLAYFTNWITPYSNMDDPITGGFVKFIKTKMSDALTASQNEADDITVKLLPLLNAVGYNPAKTNQLGDMLLFTDKIGYTTNDGVFEEKDVLTFLNKFKNYRVDRARLQNNFDQAKATKDKIKMKEAYDAIQDFDEKYMHRKFKKEFYDIQKIWKTGAKVINPFTKEEITVGPKVAFDSFLERQQDLDKMNTLKNVHFLELEDMYELGDSEEQARLEYNRLFDTYGLDGKPKTGEELERVLLRQKHRELSRGMYDYSSDTDRIQKDLDNFSNQLIARGIDPEQQPAEGDDKNLYQKEMDRFFKKNLKTAYTSDYYKSRQQIFEDIRKISEKAGIKSQVVMDLAELYKERYRLANSTADNNGQPNGVNFTPEQIDLLRNIEEQIVALEASFDKKSGLLKEELARLKGYVKKSSLNQELTAEEKTDYAKLYAVKNEMALSPLEQQILRTKFSELSDISTKEATDYYVEAFNYAIKDLGLPELTIDNADSWINSTNLEEAMAASKDFTQWFTRNHYTKQRYDFASGENIISNLRLNVWTVTKPSYESAYQKTTLIDPYTKEEIIKEGVPSGKYTKSVLKNNLLTIPRGESWDNYIGTIIDNRGNFLPRVYTPGDLNSAFDNKYMNEKYEALEKENSAEFKLLKAVTESMLKVQENKATNSRLYLDMPRFRRRSNLEYIQSGETKENIVQKIGSVKEIWSTMFGKSADDVEYGYNFDEGDVLISTDLEGNAKSKIPVRGTYNLDANLVSKDVMKGMYEYLLSLNEQEILRENEPIAQALSSVLEENPIKELGKVDRDKFKLTGKKEYLNDEYNNRKDAIDYLINKTFYGKPNSDFEKKNPGITKTFQGLFKRSSRAFIAFDPQSAIKNRWGMLYQNMILASGGKYLTVASLAKGKLKAKESAAYWIFKDVYAKGMKTQDIQLIERFDPALRTRTEFGRSSSRSIAKDVLDMTYAFDFRRTMEYEASMELFWGVMYNQYVDQNGVSIPYAEAWTTDAQGILQLKDGIDPNYGFREVNHVFTGGETLDSIAKKYNISVEELKKRADITSISDLQIGQEIEVGNAKEFNRMKLLVQGVNKKATGSMDKFDTPHAEKYLWYRAFTFYKRFATGMFMDKYQIDTTKGNRGGHVYNWDTNTLERGYYMTAMGNIKNLTLSIGKDWPLLTTEEKAAMKKVAMEGLLLFILASIVGSWMFGYDPEDEERWAKIKARGETNIGYLENHLLYLLMMTQVENQAFFPGLGTKAMFNYFGSTTIATQNTIKVYIKIMGNLWDMSLDNPDAVYSQDVGPYSWQKKGKYKLWNNIGTMYGVKGKNKDAYWAIKKYETFENLD